MFSVVPRNHVGHLVPSDLGSPYLPSDQDRCCRRFDKSTTRRHQPKPTARSLITGDSGPTLRRPAGDGSETRDTEETLQETAARHTTPRRTAGDGSETCYTEETLQETAARH